MSATAINWDAMSAIGGIVSAVAGTASVIVAFLTVSKARAASAEQGALLTDLARFSADESKNLSRSVIANETYDRYLALCIRYPWLASYKLAAETYGFDDPESAWNLESHQSERYFWFLSFALNAFERILIEEENDSAWREAIQAQLAYHYEALAFLWGTDFRTHYSPELDGEVRIVLKRAPE